MTSIIAAKLFNKSRSGRLTCSPVEIACYLCCRNRGQMCFWPQCSSGEHLVPLPRMGSSLALNLLRKRRAKALLRGEQTDCGAPARHTMGRSGRLIKGFVSTSSGELQG